MSFINDTYFHTELHIPGLGNTVDRSASKLASFISKYEPIYLKMLLGENMYPVFLTGVNANIPQYVLLRDVVIDPINKNSPIANFVYCHFLEDNVSETSVVGEVKVKAENSSNVSVYPKIVRAWNEMVDLTEDIRNFISEKQTENGFYPDYEKISKVGILNIGENHSIITRGKNIDNYINRFNL